MLRARHVVLLTLAFALTAAPAVAATDDVPPATAPTTTNVAIKPAEKPSEGALYSDGPSGRYLMGGQWMFRLDKAEAGLKQGFQKSTSTVGWQSVAVPNTWNVNDNTNEGFSGTVGWYRKDFKLPSAASALSWVVRFESVNYRAQVWLNGKPLGKHTGAYLPFEFRLPVSYLNRGGVNRLVVRVDNRRRPTDFPPSGLTTVGTPTGGWWNYGGLLREVYLRKVDRVDFNTVQVQPTLPCGTCAADVKVRVTVRNSSAGAQRVTVGGSFGGKQLTLGTAAIGAKRFATFVKTVHVAKPKLWAPGTPNLYQLKLRARIGAGGDGPVVQRWSTQTGIRSIKVVNGLLYLNGRQLHFRGVGLHEDSRLKGSALDNTQRQQLIDQVRDLGATLIRSHYPLHPQLQELADKYGIMLWSEIPVYAIKTKYLKQQIVRKLASNELRDNILINGNHPAIIAWSIGNELSSRPGPVQSYYIAQAVKTAHALDPTRPVGLAVAGYPAVGCRPQYAPLDIIGINDYFGWYPGPNGTIADRTLLPDYLDSVRACYPNKAIVITETGAEANREGPVEEKGTYAFQQDYAKYHYDVYASKPWLSGAIWWALREFRVRPGWDGGNPRPSPPLHQKGVLDFDGKKKPAWTTLHDIFASTPQVGALKR
ncbi:MAG TPA: glycoside hydrolase family 2 TIM barrel-domain containing protein [Solirubrobacteraceae bacterium]|nr:glycoside hydrolase family 2 TIM barrel-domain containing protein [Solirubrobacteraceae bacterium]